MKKAIGIDIGGTKIATGIVDENGQLLKRLEIKSDPTDREKMFKNVIEVVEDVLDGTTWSEIEGIGVGVPGKVDRENGIAIYQNNLPWKDFPIVSRLHDYFKDMPVVLDNDVYMAAYAEWKDANVRLNETFVYVTVSTGIACCTIHNGMFLRGAGFAGELGLIPVLSSGTNERLETVAAGPGIARRATDTTAMTTKEVFAAYQDGDPHYRALIENVSNQIAQGMYSISSLLDPNKVVFGGSVIVNNPVLLQLIKEQLKSYQLPEQQHLLEAMSISNLAQNNGVVGAGLRVFDR